MRKKPLTKNDPRHGRVSTYSYYKCRCKPCCEANRIYHRKMRAAVGGLHPSGKARSYANTKVLAWVLQEHPEVWQRFYTRGKILYGEGKVGRPRSDAA